MDTINKVVGQGKESNDPGATNSGGGEQEDYGDKAAEYLNKKYVGDKLSSEQREKITDAGRESIGKITGKEVPEKISQ